MEIDIVPEVYDVSYRSKYGLGNTSVDLIHVGTIIVQAMFMPFVHIDL
jgi:hypothetical protein